MLEAFVLGFWIIWSSDREVYPLSESLWFTLIAVILRQLTAFDLPIIDTYWMIFNGIVWAFAGLIFSIVGRIDSNFFISCVLVMALLIIILTGESPINSLTASSMVISLLFIIISSLLLICHT